MTEALLKVQTLKLKIESMRGHLIISLPPIGILIEYILKELEEIEKCLM
jgi:hypothetical protein